MTNLETLAFYLEAKTPCLWIHTFEEARVIEDLKEISFNKKYAATTWTCTEGTTELAISSMDEEKTNANLDNADLLFKHIKRCIIAKESVDTLWIFKDMNRSFTTYPLLYRHIRDVKEYNQGTKYHPFIVISTDSKIPAQLDKLFAYIEYDTMSTEELEDIVHRMDGAARKKYADAPQVEESTLRSIAQNLGGLTFIEVTNILKRSIISEHALDLKFVMGEKIKLIQKTEVLEYKVPQTSFDSIGGNENFKEWIKSLEAAMQPEARAFGCAMPKGYMSLGVPGTGKTFMAEALAAKLGIPYIEFSISRIN